MLRLCISVNWFLLMGDAHILSNIFLIKYVVFHYLLLNGVADMITDQEVPHSKWECLT